MLPPSTRKNKMFFQEKFYNFRACEKVGVSISCVDWIFLKRLSSLKNITLLFLGISYLPYFREIKNLKKTIRSPRYTRRIIIISSLHKAAVTLPSKSRQDFRRITTFDFIMALNGRHVPPAALTFTFHEFTSSTKTDFGPMKPAFLFLSLQP